MSSPVPIRSRPHAPVQPLMQRYESSSSGFQATVMEYIAHSYLGEFLDQIGTMFYSVADAERLVRYDYSCSVNGIQLCDQAQPPFFSGVKLLMIIVGLYVAASLGIPMVGGIATTMLLGFLFIWIHHTYGMAPWCLPMLPTCAIVDGLDILNMVTPRHIKTELIFTQLTESSSGNSTNNPWQRCTALGFSNGLDNILYVITVGSLTYGPARFRAFFSAPNAATPPLLRFADEEITASLAYRL